jgi:hypothetical protein
MPATSVVGPLSRAWACRSAHSRPLGRRRMPGEPGPAPLPGVVEAWPSVAPFGEADRISVSIIALAFLCSSAGSTFASPGGKQPHVAAHSSDHRIRSGLRPRGSPPVRRSQTSAAATLREVEQCRSSMARSPGHQLADPDHQQWPPHNAQICAAGAERGIDAATAPNGGSARGYLARLSCPQRSYLEGFLGRTACVARILMRRRTHGRRPQLPPSGLGQMSCTGLGAGASTLRVTGWIDR